MIPKFRAFSDGKMYYPEYNDWWFTSGYGYWSLNNSKDNILVDSLESKNPHIMLSSTLKDSKQIEIYEGDILRSIMINGSITDGIVEFQNGCFIVRQDGLESMFCCLNEINLNHVEVVGNIYEGLKGEL